MKMMMIMLLKMKMIVQWMIMKMPGDDGDAIEMYYHLIAPDIFSTSNAKNRSILEGKE